METPILVICAVKSEKKLYQQIKYLKSIGISYRAFYEPDIGNECTAVASEPIKNNQRHLFSKYMLWKHAT